MTIARRSLAKRIDIVHLFAAGIFLAGAMVSGLLFERGIREVPAGTDPVMAH